MVGSTSVCLVDTNLVGDGRVGQLWSGQPTFVGPTPTWSVTIESPNFCQADLNLLSVLVLVYRVIKGHFQCNLVFIKCIAGFQPESPLIQAFAVLEQGASWSQVHRVLLTLPPPALRETVPRAAARVIQYGQVHIIKEKHAVCGIIKDCKGGIIRRAERARIMKK